jgi:hypothetical protein
MIRPAAEETGRTTVPLGWNLHGTNRVDWRRDNSRLGTARLPRHSIARARKPIRKRAAGPMVSENRPLLRAGPRKNPARIVGRQRKGKPARLPERRHERHDKHAAPDISIVHEINANIAAAYESYRTASRPSDECAPHKMIDLLRVLASLRACDQFKKRLLSWSAPTSPLCQRWPGRPQLPAHAPPMRRARRASHLPNRGAGRHRQCRRGCR